MDRKIFRILALCLVAVWLAGTAQAVWAKYPDKQIRFIVPVAPGGGADTLARTLVRFMNPHLDNRVYIENVQGAGNAIGFREGAKAAPDGYTVTMLVTSITITPNITKGYPTIDMFDPLCILATDPAMLTVPIESPFKTVADLIAYAKANPGKLSVGTSGKGSPGHLAMAAFGDATGTRFTYVPFKGSAPVLTATAGKHIDVGTSTCSEANTLVKGGKLRPLIVLNPDRSPLFPEVPTSKDIGIDVFVSYWRGAGVPKGTPAEAKRALVEAFRKALESEECKKFLEQQGLNRVFLTPEQATPWLLEQQKYFKGIADKIGLKPE